MPLLAPCATCNGMGYLDGQGTACGKCGGEGSVQPAQPVAVPLTDEEIAGIWVEHGCDGDDAENFARAAIAAFCAKNSVKLEGGE